MSALRSVARWVLAVFFIAAGANHFRAPEFYFAMMPAGLPWPAALNAISGAAEMLGGVGLLVPWARRWAGWGLIALLVAVFPANLHVALEGKMPGEDFSPLLLWVRLPFQAGFIAWVWWVARRPELHRSNAGVAPGDRSGADSVNSSP
ncbi:MAG: DoxX family membrane protein [Opitutus sp.]|nr:DoxX family membrane protein [Opitutus sp.]